MESMNGYFYPLGENSDEAWGFAPDTDGKRNGAKVQLISCNPWTYQFKIET